MFISVQFIEGGTVINRITIDTEDYNRYLRYSKSFKSQGVSLHRRAPFSSKTVQLKQARDAV